VDQYPTSEWMDETLLGLFKAYTAIEWDREAEEVRTRLLRDFPDSEAAKEIGSERGSSGGDGGAASSLTGETEDLEADRPGSPPSSTEPS